MKHHERGKKETQTDRARRWVIWLGFERGGPQERARVGMSQQSGAGAGGVSCRLIPTLCHLVQSDVRVCGKWGRSSCTRQCACACVVPQCSHARWQYVRAAGWGTGKGGVGQVWACNPGWHQSVADPYSPDTCIALLVTLCHKYVSKKPERNQKKGGRGRHEPGCCLLVLPAGPCLPVRGTYRLYTRSPRKEATTPSHRG